jgi:3-deoxy-D-manno-octulosonic-acid transferase
VRHFVLIRLYRLGDLLMASALARAWKQEEPTSVTWIVGEESASLIRDQPYVDRLIVVPMRYVHAFQQFAIWAELEQGEERFALKEAREEYARLFDALPPRADRVVNLSFNAAASMLGGAIAAPERAGPYSGEHGEKRIDDLWSQYYLAVGTDLRFSVVHWVDAFINIGGAPRRDIKTEFRAKPDLPFLRWFQEQTSGAPYVVVQLGASEEQKKWPEGHFTAAAEAIARDLRVAIVLVGGPKDRIPCLRAVRELSRAGVLALSLAGETDFHQLALVLAGSAGLLSNDTFTQHLAAAIGTPSVTVYQGRVTPWLTLGYLEGNRAVLEGDGSAPPVEKVVGTLLGATEDYLVAQRIAGYQFPMPASPAAETNAWRQRWIVGGGHLRALDRNMQIAANVRVGFPVKWLTVLEEAQDAIRRGTIVDSVNVEREIVEMNHPLLALAMMLSIQNRFSSAFGDLALQAENYRRLAEALVVAGRPE